MSTIVKNKTDALATLLANTHVAKMHQMAERLAEVEFFTRETRNPDHPIGHHFRFPGDEEDSEPFISSALAVGAAQRRIKSVVR